MTLIYETAKKLYGVDSPFASSVPVTEANMDYISYPPLEELIEACGHGFGDRYLGLNTLTNEYEIIESIDGGYDYGAVVSGSTPSEAVANLWLELNKK